MARRYCGAMRVTVVWDDAAREVHAAPQRGAYRCTVTDGEGGRWKGVVWTEAWLEFAVDAPEAYDAAARVALTFAIHDDVVDDLREFDRETDEPVILRRRPSHTQAEALRLEGRS